MRVSDNMTFDQVRHNVSQNRSEMTDLQNQAATQKRVTRPSDDPIAAAQVLGARVDLKGNGQFQKNLEYAKSFLDFTDQTLGELTNHMSRLKELTLSQANDASSNAESRRVVAVEVAQIYDQIVAIGNRKLGDRFIFGGYKTTKPPFDISGNYAGDSNEIMIQVDKESFVPMNLPGAKVFLGLGEAESPGQTGRQQPRSTEEMIEQNEREAEQVSRRLASGESAQADKKVVGLNLFDVVKNLEISLQANDKEGIQSAIDPLDQALEQVVLSRAEVGSRAMTLDGAMETLQHQEVGSQATISTLEDADIFKVVSDINKNESALQATLQTAGKIMPKSLLDFVR